MNNFHKIKYIYAKETAPLKSQKMKIMWSPIQHLHKDTISWHVNVDGRNLKQSPTPRWRAPGNWWLLTEAELVFSKDKSIVHYKFSSLYPWALTEIHLSNAVVVHLGFQLDYVCNQQRHMWLAILVRDFLGWIIWGERTHHKSGLHIFVATHIKGHRRKEFRLFVCLPSLFLASSYVLLLQHSLATSATFFACDRTYFSGFQQWQITSSSLGPGLQKQNGTAKI